MSGAGAAAMLASSGAPGVVALPASLASTGVGAVTIDLQNDGDWVSADDGTGEWVTPSTAAVAAHYQARASSLSGDTGSATGTFDSWLDLSTTRTWGVSGSAVAINFLLEIREKGSGTVRDSCTCVCTVS